MTTDANEIRDQLAQLEAERMILATQLRTHSLAPPSKAARTPPPHLPHRPSSHSNRKAQVTVQPSQHAQGGRGAVVPGCVTCHKRLHTSPEFLMHQVKDVLPAFFARLRERYPWRLLVKC